MITQELLDALLSPNAAVANDEQSPRQQAESHYQSIPLFDRVKGLFNLLNQMHQTSTPNDDAKKMLVCVLLRRDLASLAGAKLSQAGPASSSSAEISLLKEITGPLLSLFLEDGSNGNEQFRRMVGHCIAEACLSLTVLSSVAGDEVMKGVLNGVGQGCAAADPTSLRLLKSLAERSPLSLCRSGTPEGIASLLSSAISSLQNQPVDAQYIERVEALLGATCEVGVSLEMSERARLKSKGNEADELMYLLRAQAGSSTEALGRINPQSHSSSLGRTCLPPLLEMILKVAPSNSDEVLCKCMEYLSHAASHCPSLLAGDANALTLLAKTCLSVASISALEGSTRLSALEVLAAVCDIDDVKMTLLSGSSSAVPLLRVLLAGEGVAGVGADASGVLRICAEFIVNGVDDDVEEWSMDAPLLQDDSTSWEEDDNAVYAESLIESFLHNLGGSNTLPAVLPLVETLLGNASNADVWQQRRAALSVLERCLIAAPVAFEAHMPVAIETAISLSADPSPRVQFQSLQLLGALCIADTVDGEGVGKIRTGYGARMLQSMANLVSSPCMKVASHASLAIVSYCRGGNGREDCGVALETSSLVPFLSDLMSALTSGPLSLDMTNASQVRNGAATVLIRAIAAVSCLANAAGTDFVPFYGSTMPGLLGCANFGLEVDQASGCVRPVSPQALNHEFSMLRGAALESATIVGQAIGDDNVTMYHGDAEKIMALALPLLKAPVDQIDVDSIVPMDQLLAACARVANVIKDEYAQFLPCVLPRLLERAQAKADVSVTDGDESGLEVSKRGELEKDDEEGTESVTVALPGMGLKKLTMNTTQIQEKAQAARATYEHANALGSAFGPYAETCAGVFLPLVEFKYSAEVRSTSAQAMSKIFDAACEYALSAGGAASSLPQNLFPVLVKTFANQLQQEDQDDTETLFALADSLSEVCYSAFRHVREHDGQCIARLDFNQARELVSQLVSSIGTCLERRSAIIQSTLAVVTDEDEKAQCEDLLQIEADVLTEYVNSIGYTIKTLRDSFVPIFDSMIAPTFGKLLLAECTNDIRARFASVCLFDDLIEYCGSAAAAKYAQTLIPGVMQGIDDSTNGGDTELKQVSVYGIAQIARYAPSSALSSVAFQILPNLISIVSEAGCTNDGEDENSYLVEVAMSALSSMFIFNGAPFANADGVDKTSMLSKFLQVLPIRQDYDEAKICHDGLCDLVESGAINMSSEAPALMRIIGQIFADIEDGEKIASPATCSRLAAILNKIQETADGALIQKSYSMLSPEAQNGIQSALQGGDVQ